MAYEEQCGGCTSFDFQGDYSKGYCSYYKAYYYPGDSCSHQTPRFGSSSCYITTIMCDILKKDDNCEELQNLRELRSYMQQKEEYHHLIAEYDVVGPKIAKTIKELYNNDHNEGIWDSVYRNFIEPTSEFTSQKKYYDAITTYTTMVEIMKKTFNIRSDFDTPKNYDASIGGHGYVLKPIPAN